jgi:hypothetical protein
MSQRDDMTPDDLRSRIEELGRTIELRDRLSRLEERARRGPGLGSPAAMRTKQPTTSIGAGVGDDWDRVRHEFLRLGNYEAL